ncbi:hydroxymethylbilane synthase, partial [Alphaproteobacteria bacterium]|nr:hydroxymethylbilane synthase [Alphaproteobacteria bacterium]
DGSCKSPISSSAYIVDNDYLLLYGAVANLDGTMVIKSEIKGRKEDAVLLGQELGKEIMIKSNGKTIYK